jgi:uncharacterized damage-inducible protein DinB
MSEPEVWLRGPIPGVPPLLMPAAHALAGAREDLHRAVEGLSGDHLWARPAGVASVGFHLRHVAGILDRLLTYARGEALTESQLAYLRAEAALAQIRATLEADLLLPRGVGRQQLPSTVMGLVFHAAEHAQRHTGQVVTLSRIVRGGVP